MLCHLNLTTLNVSIVVQLFILLSNFGTGLFSFYQLNLIDITTILFNFYSETGSCIKVQFCIEVSQKSLTL